MMNNAAKTFIGNARTSREWGNRTVMNNGAKTFIGNVRTSREWGIRSVTNSAAKTFIGNARTTREWGEAIRDEQCRENVYRKRTYEP